MPRRKPGPKKKPRIKPNEVRGGKYLRNILDLLRPLHEHRDCPNRELHYDEYVAYILLYFFTPVLTSLRGLQQVSEFEVIRRKLKLGRFSLGSFSEAGRVFDPQLLVPIIEEVAAKLGAVGTIRGLSPQDLALTAVDGTLLHALPKMLWALWTDGHNRAAKMHLEYSILKGVPVAATVTDANTHERTVLKENLSAGKLYVLDRGYACYDLMADITDARSSFVVRICNNAVYQTIRQRPVSDPARRAGIQKDLIVHLGTPGKSRLHGRCVRLIQLHVAQPPLPPGRRHPSRVSSKKTFRKRGGDHTLLLVTDLLDLDAEIIAEIYRSRWQIELFFRWFKKVLQADHPLSLSKNGMTIVVYCALIASMLVVLWTGRKPTKRTYEMICFYFLGWVSEAELAAHINKLPPVD